MTPLNTQTWRYALSLQYDITGFFTMSTKHYLQKYTFLYLHITIIDIPQYVLYVPVS